MTDEEIKQFCKQSNETKIHGTDKDLYITYQAAIACTVIDYIRKDLKRIVSDAVKEAVSTAVKEAVGTLNSDKKSLSPDESAWHDFAETRYGNFGSKEVFHIDDTGKHPIAANTYKGQYRYRAKLSLMGITHYEDIHGYLTDSPMAAQYSLLVNDKWLDCPRNFTAYDFAGLSEDMKLLGLDFQSSPMKDLDEAWKKANEPERHHIDNVPFNYSETRHQLRINGVQFLDEIDGYRLLEYSEYNSVTAKGSVFLILKKYFNDLKATMNAYCVPFLPIEIRSKTK